MIARIRADRLKRPLEDHLSFPFAMAGALGAVRVVSATDLDGLHHFRLRRDKETTIVAFDYTRHLARKYFAFSTRLGPVIAMFRAARSVREALVDISDGEEGRPGFIGYDSKVAGSVLVADNDFYDSHGYQSFRQEARFAPRWADRTDTITWRGSTTGQGVISRDQMTAGDDTLLQRTRMCLLLRGQPGADVKFIAVIHSPESARDEARLKAAGLIGEPIPAFAWAGQKYALVIDGNSGPWTNLFTRLLLGCCIIRIASRFGYGQWYYDDLRAWEHYVPVERDMSDLIEKIAWCRSHERECAEIAARGQEFAMRRTFETEVDLSIERIDRAFGSGSA